MQFFYHSNNFWRLHGTLLVWACQWPSSQPPSFPQLSHNDSLWAQGITKSHREQGLECREGEQLSWCPSWSNSLWQGWSGNATDIIWRVLPSSDGISSWTPLKPQHSTTNPNPLANQLWCIDFLTPPTPPSQTPWLPWISYATQKLMLDSCKMVENQSEAFHMFLWHFSKFKTQSYCISFFYSVLMSRLHFWNSPAVTIKP